MQTLTLPRLPKLSRTQSPSNFVLIFTYDDSFNVISTIHRCRNEQEIPGIMAAHPDQLRIGVHRNRHKKELSYADVELSWFGGTKEYVAVVASFKEGQQRASLPDRCPTQVEAMFAAESMADIYHKQGIPHFVCIIPPLASGEEVDWHKSDE